MARRFELLPGQRDDETAEAYVARLKAVADARMIRDDTVPERFSHLGVPRNLTLQHPVFRTSNHDYGSRAVTQYERPITYRPVSHEFTERQHLGINFRHSGFNM
jgi:hypothetical protein